MQLIVIFSDNLDWCLSHLCYYVSYLSAIYLKLRSVHILRHTFLLIYDLPCPLPIIFFPK